MLSFIVFLLLFIVPGIIAALIFEHLCGRKLTCCRSISTALIFNLLILIINFFGLFFFKHICTLERLIHNLNYLKFAAKYGLLSIFVGIILAIIIGIVCRWCHCKKHYKDKDKAKTRTSKSN